MKNSICSFVLREGRFSKAQRDAIKQLFPIYGLPIIADGKKANFLDFQKIFGRNADTILEIGFGVGDTLVAMAESQPGKNFIGIEVFRPGIGAILQQIHTRQLTNIRIIHYDAAKVLQDYIADNSVSCVQIFFPDPWPKRRHHKRRLVQPELVNIIQQKLKPQGTLHIATDWEDYAKHIEEIFAQAPGWIEQSMASFDRPITKFERRGKKLNHKIWDICFCSSIYEIL